MATYEFLQMETTNPREPIRDTGPGKGTKSDSQGPGGWKRRKGQLRGPESLPAGIAVRIRNGRALGQRERSREISDISTGVLPGRSLGRL